MLKINFGKDTFSKRFITHFVMGDILVLFDNLLSRIASHLQSMIGLPLKQTSNNKKVNKSYALPYSALASTLSFLRFSIAFII